MSKKEYLLLKDQNGAEIKVSESEYNANRDLFNYILDDPNIIKPSWLRKEHHTNESKRDY